MIHCIYDKWCDGDDRSDDDNNNEDDKGVGINNDDVDDTICIL